MPHTKNLDILCDNAAPDEIGPDNGKFTPTEAYWSASIRKQRQTVTGVT